MRSRDGGRTWTELNWPTTAQSLHIARVPRRTLYLEVQASPDDATTEILKSRDEGQHWTTVGRGTGFILVDQDAGPVFLSVGKNISRSTDEGATWTEASLPQTETEIQTRGLQRLVSNVDSALFIGASRFDSAALAYISLVLVSTDAGATFATRAVPTPADGRPAELSLDCQGRLYVFVDKSVYRSSDLGTTWQSVATLGASVLGFHVSQGPQATCGSLIYATGALETGVLQLFTFDDFGNYTMQALSGGGNVSDLGDAQLLHVPWFGPPQRSDDGGRSWWTPAVSLGLGSVSSSVSQPGLLFATTGEAVYRSEDGGISWTVGALHTRGSPSGLYPDPYDANVVYASNGTGSGSPNGGDLPWAFVSRDKGLSFQNWPVPSQEHQEVPIAVASSAPGVVTVATQQGVYRTEDAGAHFSRVMALSDEERILGAAIGAGEPPAIYVYLHGADAQSHEVRTSLDGGATWASGDLGSRVDQLVAHPTDEQVAFAVSAGPMASEILRTVDAGKSWSHVPLPVGEAWVQLRIDPLPPHALYAIGAQLHRSTDRASTWLVLAKVPERGDLELSADASGAARFLGESGVLYEFVE